ncbi:phosphohistidine phosphatase SixA [Alteromonas pelagimontana]|uniref:Phosphohistidine phosphatase SixA n=1 Tax=Alteromonas pelagimontana TaxID=1858656 RepID=A0A6M4MB82_9ALTE|nr:phosphohistidine phosphatase SixA [Alteromonas pelagimontana]QJR79860.1 phosphohistidine phosphatase SixA [Alteromonas pelagimontana]
MSGQSSNDDILLFVMRHGEAASLCLDDRSRELTENGRKQSIATARWLAKEYCQDNVIDLALVSPYRRTQQTLDMMTLDLRVNRKVICEDIIPEGNSQLAHDYLDALLASGGKEKGALKRVLLVSHMPLVSYLVDELCGLEATSLFSTASVAVISYSLRHQSGKLLLHYQGL